MNRDPEYAMSGKPKPFALYAAAFYNLLAGIIVSVYPDFVYDFLEINYEYFTVDTVRLFSILIYGIIPVILWAVFSLKYRKILIAVFVTGNFSFAGFSLFLVFNDMANQWMSGLAVFDLILALMVLRVLRNKRNS